MLSRRAVIPLRPPADDESGSSRTTCLPDRPLRFPDTANGVGRPGKLCPEDRAPKGCSDGVWADVDEMTKDPELKRWILKLPIWADPPEEPKPELQLNAIIEPTYLPFTQQQLLDRFLIVNSDDLPAEHHLQYYLRSADRYRRFNDQTLARATGGLGNR